MLLYSVQYNFKKSITEPKGFELGFKKILCIFLNAHLYECFLSLVKINVKCQLAESFSFSCSFSIDSSILPWGKSGQSRKYLCMRLWPLTTLGIRFLCYIVGLFSTNSISITVVKIIVSNFHAMLASKSVNPPPPPNVYCSASPNERLYTVIKRLAIMRKLLSQGLVNI